MNLGAVDVCRGGKSSVAFVVPDLLGDVLVQCRRKFDWVAELGCRQHA